MSSYELLFPKKINRNPLTGQFIKGHTPFNKGKKWDDMNLDEAKRKRMLECLKLGRKHQNGGGRQPIKVIGIKNRRIIGEFRCAVDAGLKLGISDRNIRSCCYGVRKRAGGIQWFFSSDIDKWMPLIDC